MSISKSLSYKLLFGVGWCLFWLAGSRGESVPAVVLLVGPAIMFAAIILLRRDRQRAVSLTDAGLSRPGSAARQPLQNSGDVVKPSTRNQAQGASREGAAAT